MIEKEKSLVPMNMVLKSYELLSFTVKQVFSSGIRVYNRYYYFDGSWVRGSSRLKERIDNRYEEYIRLLKLKNYLESGEAFVESALLSNISTEYAYKYVQKYTKENFFKSIKTPFFDIEKIKEGILDHYYCNTNLVDFPNTRYYLYKDLSKNILSRLNRGTVVREDFIMNVEKLFPFLEFEFSDVPDILDSTNQPIIVKCISRNPTKLWEEVGFYKTSYRRLVIAKTLPKCLGTYFIRHSVEEYLNLVREYKENEKTYLPSPYFYKVFVKKYRRHSRSNYNYIETLWFDPITGTFKEIRSLQELIPKLYGNISFLEFENLWYLDLTPDKLFTEEWALKKANFYYSNKPENTRLYISRELLKNPNYKFNGLMVKEDFIDEYYKTKPNRELDIEYSFCNLPDIIMTKKQKVNVTYFYKGEIKSAKTSYMDFIEGLSDVSDFKMIKIAKRLSMTNDEFIEKATRLHGDHFDFTKTMFIDKDTDVLVKCKICGKEQYIKPRNLLIEGYLGCCRKNIISAGESYIEKWIDNNLNLFDHCEQHYHIPGDIIKGRSDDKRGVFIDFRLIIESKEYYVEYNGEQHYQYIEHFHKYSEDSFKNQLKRDQNIRDYCSDINNNVTLLEIPYTYDSFEKVSNLLDRVFKNKELIENVVILPKIEEI